MHVLWGIRKNAPDWQEEIITTQPLKFDAARTWAVSQGFDRFRVAEYMDDDRPDFAGAISRK